MSATSDGPATPATPPAEASGPAEAARPWADRASLLVGLASAAWIAIGLLPQQLPAWPSATLGVVAIALAWPKGRALPRAAGVFLGLIGVIGAAAQIAALWGLVSFLG